MIRALALSQRLPELAYDLWWTWNPARDVFRRLDYALWRADRAQPGDDAAAHVGRRRSSAPRPTRRFSPPTTRRSPRMDADARGRDVAANVVERRRSAPTPSQVIAYFCAEFALHQSLPIYAGGLGVLAGDHCKEASDLGVPLVGVGFMYPQGYFRQRVSPEGWQQEVYEQLDWTRRADRRRARRSTASRASCSCRSATRTRARAGVGSPARPRAAAPARHRSRAERAVGSRAVGAALRRRPGHAAAAGDRARPRRRARAARARPAAGGVASERRPRGVRRAAAHARLPRRRPDVGRRARGSAADDVFTTHTPVPAGHDAFPFHLVEQHLASCWGSMNGHGELFLALGSYDTGHGPQFNMTALAMRSAGAINAVSAAARRRDARDVRAALAGRAGRRSGRSRAITNGVHVPTWVSGELARLFERHLSPAWREQYEDHAFWSRILDIPDEDLWAARQDAARVSVPVHPRARARSAGPKTRPAPRASSPAARCSIRTRSRSASRAASPATSGRTSSSATPIGSRAILNAAGRPVQLVFAGKAHPADEAGKHHLQNDLPPRARSAVRRPHRVRRRLRPARRAPARAGLRRLAQHAAQAARSQRHERHEGVDERRAASEHRRRLVGRRLRRATTAGCIAGTPTSTDADARGRGRRRGALPAARERGRADASTSATRAASRAAGSRWSSRRSSRSRRASRRGAW